LRNTIIVRFPDSQQRLDARDQTALAVEFRVILQSGFVDDAGQHYVRSDDLQLALNQQQPVARHRVLDLFVLWRLPVARIDIDLRGRRIGGSGDDDIGHRQSAKNRRNAENPTLTPAENCEYVFEIDAFRGSPAAGCLTHRHATLQLNRPDKLQTR
jgi:hypothetical protein